MDVKMRSKFVARGADLIGMGRGQNRREDVVRALVLEPVEPHIGPCAKDVGVDRVREIFDVEYALVVDGHADIGDG